MEELDMIIDDTNERMDKSIQEVNPLLPIPLVGELLFENPPSCCYPLPKTSRLYCS